MRLLALKAFEMDDFKKYLQQEFKKIEQDSSRAAQEHLSSAGQWRVISYWIGIPSTILAAVSGVAAFSDTVVPLLGINSNVIAGILSVLVAVLTALLTYLNPTEQTNSHRNACSRYTALGNKARLLANIELALDEANLDASTKEAIGQLKELSNQFNELNQVSPQVSRKVAKRVARALDAGIGKTGEKHEQT